MNKMTSAFQVNSELICVNAFGERATTSSVFGLLPPPINQLRPQRPRANLSGVTKNTWGGWVFIPVSFSVSLPEAGPPWPP